MDKQNNQQPKDTEQLILEAATKEFSTKGFDGARTSAIAAEAGVTHAMLHYYFRTKEKLFERIFHDKLSYVINMVLASLAKSKDNIKVRIARMVEEHMEFIKNNRELPIFFITTIHTRPEAFKEAVSKFSSDVLQRITDLQEELDKAHANGEISRTDARTLIGDIACLNVFPFLAQPMMMPVMGYDNFDDYLEARKQENIEIILKRIS